MKKIKAVALIIIIIFGACKTIKHTETVVVAKPILECTNMNLSYNTDIKPIIEKYCIRCHGDDGEGGFDFNKMLFLKKAAKSGELIGTIKWKRGYPKMPRHAKQLDSLAINSIECWVKNGMKE